MAEMARVGSGSSQELGEGDAFLGGEKLPSPGREEAAAAWRGPVEAALNRMVSACCRDAYVDVFFCKK